MRPTDEQVAEARAVLAADALERCAISQALSCGHDRLYELSRDVRQGERISVNEIAERVADAIREGYRVQYEAAEMVKEGA